MHSFFGITPDSTGGTTLTLLLAALLGGLIGLERELHGHPAGMRTHILVCVGSTLITQVSIAVGRGTKGDPGHIAAQIVSGIGFLGAGAIIREGATIRGLTTAASIWATAGIGIALGANGFYAEIAVIATVIVLFNLWILNIFEDWINVRAHRDLQMQATIRDTNRAAADLLARIAAHDISIRAVHFEGGKDPHTRVLLLLVCLPDGFDRVRFMADMSELPGVVGISLP